jgi:hypothetical protein
LNQGKPGKPAGFIEKVVIFPFYTIFAFNKKEKI